MSKVLLDPIGFGKYADSPLIEVIENDPDYIRWLIDKTGFKMDEKATLRFEKVTRGNNEPD